MWRLTGFVGRALPRPLGPGFQGLTTKSTRPDGCPATSSALLVPESNFDRSGPNGPRRNRGPKCHGWKDVYHWMSARVSPSTLWDAISWGSLAVLALHLARQIHFQASLATRPQPVERCSWHSPVTRFLSSPWWHLHSSLRRNVLPGDSPAPRHTGLGELKLGQEEHSVQPGHFPSQNSLRAGLRDPPEEDPNDFDFLHASRGSTSKAKATEAHSPGVEKEQDKPKTLSLEEAVTSIQQLFQLSVSIAFNFLGTENMKNENYEAAFSYFQKAADRGYSKAQYNVGLCHEHGRGTPRNLGKAILYYHLAATQGHNLAKYRYARCLLREPGSSGHPEQQTAVCMLRQAADSGLREAQAFLGVLFTKEPYLDERKAVKYLWLAANNGDSQSWYHLGICYERGLGVQRNLGEAVKCYQQSAAMGNKPAQERLRTLFSMETAAPGPSHLATTGLKSFSSPSLCSLNTLLAGPLVLPHASSTGNLGLLCRSGHLGANLRDPSRGIPSLDRSLVRLGFG